MCRQVSRLDFILIGTFPLLSSGFVAFRQFHGYWDSPTFSVVFPRYRTHRHVAMQKHIAILPLLFHITVIFSIRICRSRSRRTAYVRASDDRPMNRQQKAVTLASRLYLWFFHTAFSSCRTGTQSDEPTSVRLCRSHILRRRPAAIHSGSCPPPGTDMPSPRRSLHRGLSAEYPFHPAPDA